MSEYYLALDDPRSLRKTLLTSAKTSVSILKSQYTLRDIREKKAAHLLQLTEVIEEISLMLSQLEKELPVHEATKMPAVAQRVQAKSEGEHKKLVENKPSKPTPKKVAPTPSVEKKTSSKPAKASKEERAAKALSALESKLSSIESKLNKL